MIPIKDDNPQVGIPYAVYILVALNVLAWFLLQGFGSSLALNASVCQFGLIPADLTGAILQAGAPDVCGPPQGSAWLGLFSSMFMHGSWMHIIGNLWFLWIFGDNVEDAMGSLRFVIFYLLCGLMAAAAQIFSNTASTIPMVGASGAIGGVMGAYLVLYPRVKVHLLFILVIIFTTFRVPAIALLGYWVLIQFLGGLTSSGATGGVAFWAHIGGFVAGVMLVFLFKDEELLANHPYRGFKRQQSPADIWKDPENRA